MDKNNLSINVNFETLKETRLKIKQSFIEIDTIKSSIKQNYVNYIKQESDDFFGLDMCRRSYNSWIDKRSKLSAPQAKKK